MNGFVPLHRWRWTADHPCKLKRWCRGGNKWQATQEMDRRRSWCRDSFIYLFFWFFFMIIIISITYFFGLHHPQCCYISLPNEREKQICTVLVLHAVHTLRSPWMWNRLFSTVWNEWAFKEGEREKTEKKLFVMVNEFHSRDLWFRSAMGHNQGDFMDFFILYGGREILVNAGTRPGIDQQEEICKTYSCVIKQTLFLHITARGTRLLWVNTETTNHPV